MARSTSALAVTLVLLLAVASDAKLSNMMVDWIEAAQSTIAMHTGMVPHLASRSYALVGLAAHRAIKQGGASRPALIAYASHAVLSSQFPWSQGRFDMLLGKHVANYTSEEREAAEKTALSVVWPLLKPRVGDAMTRWANFKPAAPGTRWRYQFSANQTMAIYPQHRNTAPMVLPAADLKQIVYNVDPAKGRVFRPPMSRSDYMATYDLGRKGTTNRTQEETDTAMFWMAGANTSQISGMWLNIAKEVLPASLSLADTALFFARAGAAAFDTSIATWKLKYGLLHWRPEHVFQQGVPSLNIPADPSWWPAFPTPPHPEYPSGHQANAGAILEVILRTLGNKDEVGFSITSEGAPQLAPKTFPSLAAAATNGSAARLFAGAHFPSSNADGLALGRLIGGKVFEAIQ